MGWFAGSEYPPLAIFHQLILSQLEHTTEAMGWYEAPWVVAHPR